MFFKSHVIDSSQSISPPFHATSRDGTSADQLYHANPLWPLLFDLSRTLQSGWPWALPDVHPGARWTFFSNRALGKKEPPEHIVTGQLSSIHPADNSADW